MEKSNTSARLTDLMNSRNMKQVDILKLCEPFCKKYNQKINKSHLSQWVSGINEPNQAKLTILSLALGVSEPWLMGYDVPMERENRIANVEVEYSKESALLLNKIRKSTEYHDTLSKFLDLDDEKKKAVSMMIDALHSELKNNH